MNKYELTLVLPGKGKVKEKTFTEKIEKIVKVSDGKVLKKETWGELELSYPLKKETTGFFLHFNLELEGSAVKALDEKMRLDDDLIRYLLVRKD
jgi:small subunit ribosomal protein S6